MGHGCHVVERQAFSRRDRGSKPHLPFRSFGNFFHSTLPVSFGRDSKSCWSLLFGVYARGSKRSHAGKWKKPVMHSLSLEKDTLKSQCSIISKQILLNGW